MILIGRWKACRITQETGECSEDLGDCERIDEVLALDHDDNTSWVWAEPVPLFLEIASDNRVFLVDEAEGEVTATESLVISDEPVDRPALDLFVPTEKLCEQAGNGRTSYETQLTPTSDIAASIVPEDDDYDATYYDEVEFNRESGELQRRTYLLWDGVYYTLTSFFYKRERT